MTLAELVTTINTDRNTATYRLLFVLVDHRVGAFVALCLLFKPAVNAHSKRGTRWRPRLLRHCFHFFSYKKDAASLNYIAGVLEGSPILAKSFFR
jgi:hypothetical protein